MPLWRTRRQSPTVRTSRRPRRRVDVARFSRSATVAVGVVDIAFPLTNWESDVGLAAGGHLPGITVGGVRYRLSVDNTGGTAGNVFQVAWGFIVANEMITTAADFSPLLKEHMDWMEWGLGWVTAATVGSQFLVGQGDDSFRTTRTRRLRREVEDDLVFAIAGSSPFTYRLVSSTAVMLP